MQKIFDILFSLNDVKFSKNTHFGWGVDWRQWILPTVIALVLLGWWSYQRQSVAKGRRLWLWLVRGLLLAAVFLLFCRPQLVLEREDMTRSVVAVWVDSSESMTLEDPYKDPGMREFTSEQAKKIKLLPGQARLNRYQLAIGALEDAKWLKTLTATQDVSFYSGAGHARLLGTAYAPEQVQTYVDRLKSEKPTGETTDVPTVVREIIQSVQGRRVSALVLLTDGQTTEAGSRMDQSVSLAQLSTAKVFPLPLGESNEPFNLSLTNLQVPEFVFVRDPVAVKVHVAGSGIEKPTQVKVAMYRKKGNLQTPLVDANGRTVEKEITLQPTKKELDVELIFKPEKIEGDSERFDLVAKLEQVGGAPVEELTLADNDQTGYTTVRDAQINVLFVDAYPRYEYRYLKNELIRERTVNVSALLLNADEDFPQEGDPAVIKDGQEVFPGPIKRFPETQQELDKYQVLLIGDVEAAYFSPSQQKLIADFVRLKGGGIGWIAGPNWNPEGYKGTPLEPLIPIIPDENDPRSRVMPLAPNEGFNMVLTAAGKESNLFRFFDDPEQNVRQMGELPEMYWYKPVLGIKPGADVLAVHPTQKQNGVPAPLIVTGLYGKGRTVFSAVCDTWRWRRYTGEPLFQNYWLQMCRLLYKDQVAGQDHRIELTAVSKQVEVGHPIKVTMTVNDPTLVGQIPSRVPVTVTDEGGRVVSTIMLQRDASVEGEIRLEGTTTATQVGVFTLTVEPGLLPMSPTYEVTVERPQRELQTVTADVESLGSLATKTTGEILPVYQAESLTKLVPDRSLRSITSLAEDLWYKPIALVLVVVLATVEWLLRKRAGLI